MFVSKLKKNSAMTGFTLIEVQVAIVILLLIVLVLMGSLNLFGKTNKATQQLMDNTVELRAITNLLQQQLSSLVPLSVIENNQQAIVFQGDESAIYFMGYLPEKAIDGGPWLLKLYKKDNELLLGYSVLDNQKTLKTNLAGEFEEVVLTKQILGLRFEYKSNENWQKSWEEEVFPSKVKVVLENELGEWPEIVVSLKAHSATSIPTHRIKLAL